MDKVLNEELEAEGLSPEEIEALQDSGDEEISSAPEKEGEVEKTAKEGESATEDGKPAKDGKANPAADPNRPDGFVPLQALQEARAREKELNDRLRNFEEVQRQIALKLADKAGGKEEDGEQFDPNDPIQVIQNLNQRIAELEGHTKQTQEEVSAAQERQRFIQDVTSEYTQQAQQDPEIDEAYEFVQLVAQREFQQLYASSGVDFNTYFQKVLLDHSAYARSQRHPIGEYVKKLAVSRGWSPGMKKRWMEEQKNQQQQADPLEAEKAKAIKAERHKSLSGLGGERGNEYSLEDLAKMSGAELEKLAVTNPDLFERLAGV